MIDKITPRGLDKSSDHKLVSKSSMIDAVNLYIADDYVNDEGNAGVLKSVRGNVEIQYASDADRPTYESAHTKVIGSVTDNKTKIVYLFIWSQYLEDHGVWAYDPFGKLPTSIDNPVGQPNTLRKVLTTGPGEGGLPPVGGFQFPEHGFVKGDIVYTNTNTVERYPIIRDYLNDFTSESLKIDFEKDVLIYFTDNVNEPRRLNPYRCLLERTDALYGEIDNYDFTDQWDLICACPKVPLERISFTWDSDGDKFTNNFLTTPGFQYAYQTIYKDGLESAISAYSKIAFAPSVVNRGAANLVSLLTHNVCVLQIPEVSSEIKSIRLLARYGNSSNFFEIDEVPVYNDPYSLTNPETYNDNWDPNARTYRFRNDRVGFGVSPREVDKTFDAVPRKAQAQTSISNRLVFGNYLENFDNIQTDCTSKVNYQTRPPDLLDYVVKVRPSIHRTPYGNNKCVGFDLDTTEFSSKVYEGTEVTVTINYTPDRNFHIYQADGGYHQSRQVGKRSSNAYGYKRWPFHSDNNNFPSLGEGDNQNLYSGGGGSQIPYWPGTAAATQELGESEGSHVLQAYDKAFTGNAFQYNGENVDESSVSYLEMYGERFFGRNYGVGSQGAYYPAMTAMGLQNFEAVTQVSFPFYSGANRISTNEVPQFANLPIWRHDVNLDEALAIPGAGTFEDIGLGGGSHDYPKGWGPSQIGGELRALYGTSAGNPLILQGATLEFMVRFRITQDEMWNGKKLISETVIEALAGAQEGDYSWGNYVEVLEVVNTQTVDIDLGLYDQDNQENYRFPQIRPGNDGGTADPFAYLICGVGESRFEDNEISTEGSYRPVGDWSWSSAIPMSYFIVNKARVHFYLEWVNETELDYVNNFGQQNVLSNEEVGTRSRMRLGISKIDPQGREGIMTCVKKIDPRSPWWVIDQRIIESQEFQAGIEQSTQEIRDAFEIENPLLGPSARGILGEFISSGWAPHGGGHWCQRRAFGFLDTTSGNSLFKPHVAAGNYQPRLYNGSQFRFSLMDGEGGPGGHNAGGNSAYDKYGNSRYGSIAARMDVEWDYSDCHLTGKKINDAGGAGIISLTQKWWQAHMYNPEAGYGHYWVVDPAAVDELNVTADYYWDGNKWEQNGSGDLAAARLQALVSGPFFTGCIAMNPIDQNSASNSEPNANPQPFPAVPDFTTTLPLIWCNSAGVPLRDWEGSYDDPGSDDFLAQDGGGFNWLRSPYPWPQTTWPVGDINTYQGDVYDFPTDPTPFSQNYAIPLDDDGNNEGGNNPEMHGLDEWGGDDEYPFTNDRHSPGYHAHFGCVDFGKLHSHIECVGVSSFIEPGDPSSTSFKTSANHEFGIVYYDERGRHGSVNHLDSVYVAGYSNQERDGDYQGAVSISLTLNHEPPAWATHWKIAYSKNTSVSNFVQYSAGGAFVNTGENNSETPSSIYMSLNHLQGRPISYTHAWGASDENIELTDSTMPLMYTFTKGDRLRIISYMLAATNDDPGGVPERIYPLGLEFEIADMVALGAENNPLIVATESSDSLELDPQYNEKQGLFLVLKSNSAAAGFRWEDVRDEAHRWGDNCIVEIYSPTKELDADDRLYYEIGELGRVVTTGNDVGPQRAHEPETIELTEGDVFFRRAAVNLREYSGAVDDEGQLLGYQPLIVNVVEEDLTTLEMEQKGSESNFKSYYIESPVASDLFKSDSLSIGRPNAIDHDARETYREASVIHSDRDVTEAGKVSYSSFNNSLAIDKDLDLKSGGVNYLVNHDDSIFFIQKDKCGHLPIDRTLISDVLGEESLIASSNFMGTPRYYVGKAGADDNPESVVNVDNATYFAHKSLGKVFRASGVNGVNAISDIGMNSYFREVFNSAMAASMANGNDVRVVGGYDPIQSEYLVSILNPVTYGLSGASDVINAPSFDLCSWLAETEDQLGVSWFDLGLQTNQGYYPYVADIAFYIDNDPNIDLWQTLGFPVSNYVGQDINTFIQVYLSDENGGLIQYQQDDEELGIVQITCAEGGGVDPGTGEIWDPCGTPYFSYNNGSNPYGWITADGSIDMEMVNLIDPQVLIGLPEGYNQQDVINDILAGGYNLPGACPIPPRYIKQDDFNPCSYNGNGLPETDPDYIPPIYDSTGQITEASVNVLYQILQTRISEGLMTVAEATYYFPNTTTNEDIGGGQQQVQLNSSDLYFALSEAVGVTCPIPPPPHDPDPDVDEPDDPKDPIADYEDPDVGIGGEPDTDDPDPDYEDPDVGLEDDPFTEDDYYQDPDVDLEGEDLEPLPWTGNFCDYPLLGAPQNPDAITIESIQFAYSQVILQVSLGTITPEQATYLFPDLSGDGLIGSADLTYILSISSQFPISCAVEPPPPPPPTDPLPYTGNMCDYPALINSQGNIVVSSVQNAYNTVLDQLESGEITQVEATYIVPDLIGTEGIISTPDFANALNQVTMAGGSITCEIPGLPVIGDVRTQDKDPVEGRKQTQNRRSKERQQRKQKRGTSGTSSPNRRY